jgi:hypothetical protein
MEDVRRKREEAEIAVITLPSHKKLLIYNKLENRFKRRITLPSHKAMPK